MMHMSKSLRGPMKPRIMTSVDLFEIVIRLEPELKISSFYERVKDLLDIGDIKRVQKGLYMNMHAIPKVNLNELSQLIFPGSVVTLQSALSHANVINNPSRVTMSVVPVAKNFWKNGERSEASTDVGDFWIFRMPARYVECSGLPITDTESGYNPMKPWTGRDPRFSRTILFNGNQIVFKAGKARYAELYDSPLGRERTGIGQPLGYSLTGYGILKFIDIQINKSDKPQGSGAANQYHWIII